MSFWFWFLNQFEVEWQLTEHAQPICIDTLAEFQYTLSQALMYNQYLTPFSLYFISAVQLEEHELVFYLASRGPSISSRLYG